MCYSVPAAFRAAYRYGLPPIPELQATEIAAAAIYFMKLQEIMITAAAPMLWS